MTTYTVPQGRITPENMMTRKEVLLYLHTLKWFLADLGYTCVAGDYEDAEMKLYADRITVAQCREYADMVLQPGRHGRVTLILRQPTEARALVVLRWLLRSVLD